MDDVLWEFRRYQRRRNLSPLTIRHRCSQVLAFRNWLTDHGRDLLDASDEDVQGWLDSRKLDAGTRYTYLSYLRSFYRFAIRAGATKSNPIDLIEPPKRPRRLPRPTDDDDLAIAIEEAGPRMKAWLLLSALQGLRVSSIARLRVEGVDRRTMTLRVWAKGDKEHTMPLHPDVLRALDAHGMPTSGFVFTKRTPGCEHDPLSPSTVSRYIGEFFHRLGSPATAHRNRHHFVSAIVANTGDIALASELAGHESLQTTKLYAKVRAEKGREAMAGLAI